MDNTNVSGNNGGYSGYGGVGNGVNNGGLDFEAQFKNMVVTPVPVAQQTNSAGQTSLVEKLKEDKSKILLIVMAVLAGAGLIGVIISVISYVGVLIEEKENTEEEIALAEENQDDAAFYKNLVFNGKEDSDAPLLVYAAVRNGEVVATEWLEEFREASERYSKEYTNRQAIPSGATFGEVTVQTGLVGELYPEIDIIRFLLETSEGCARFDLYEDLLVIYDYEFSGVNCKETEWKKITSNVKDED